MNRFAFRCLLVGLLLVSAAFAAWTWLRPYQWDSDPQARTRIVGCEVEADHSNFWLTLHLKMLKDEEGRVLEHDLMKPVRLVTASGREIEPADTTLAGDKDQPISSIWLKFWLEQEDLNGPVILKINEGELKVRSGSGQPKLSSSGRRHFVTHSW